jgi:hypothetical protein
LRFFGVDGGMPKPLFDFHEKDIVEAYASMGRLIREALIRAKYERLNPPGSSLVRPGVYRINDANDPVSG